MCDFVEKGSLKENCYSEIRSFVQAEIALRQFINAEIASILYYTILYYTILYCDDNDNYFHRPGLCNLSWNTSTVFGIGH